MRFPLHAFLWIPIYGCTVLSTFAQISAVDDLGRTVTLPHPAQRVVSLAPGITESLFALGAGSHVVGVTEYCNYPSEARTRERVGGMINPSIEAIVNLRPDLLLMSMEGNLHQDFAALTSLKIPVFVSNPRDLDGIYRSLRALGELTGTADRARTLIDSFQARERTVISGTIAKKRVLLLVSLQPLIAAGKNTFLHELIARAGGENLAATTSLTYPTYSREMVIAQDPDMIFVMSDIIADGQALTKIFPEWSQLSAVRLQHIYRLDADIVSRPGPRSLDALELLSSIIRKGQS